MEFEKFKEESDIPESMPGWENHSNSVDTYPSDASKSLKKNLKTEQNKTQKNRKACVFCV